MQKTQINRSRRLTASAARSVFEPMEPRQLMSATSIKADDSGGPDYQMVESGGHVVLITSTASGAGANLITRTDGSTSTSKTLVSGSGSGATIYSFDDLVVASDGTVYFTAVGGAVNGRQVYKLNVANGGATAVTSKKDAYFTQLMVIGTKLYMYDSGNTEIDTLTSKGAITKLGTGQVTQFFRAKDQLFYVLGSDGGLWRSDGSTSGTYKISPDGTSFGARNVFGTQDFIYFNANSNGLSRLYRSDGSSTTPDVVAEDFSVFTNVVAEMNGDVYFSGSYYNTAGSKAAGYQLYRINGTMTEPEQMTTLTTAEGGARIDGIAAIGNSIYFNAGDGTFISSQGTADRELYRYDIVSHAVKLITTNNDLYPIETNGGVLSSYYFVAAPTKDDARFGSRRLYRTSPSDDQVEEVAGLPSYTSGSATKEDVSLVFAASKGLFYSARNNDGTGGDYDTYFVPTPYTYIDPDTNTLNVLGTDASDVMTMTVDGGEYVFTLNGVEERRTIGTFGDVRITLKLGDDKFTADESVTQGLYITGDSGNDTIIGGSGNDNILGGAGKNRLYGMAGADRLRGSNGSDFLDGGDGNDRLYGWAGSDVLLGGNGVDYLYGDDVSGLQGNDQLNGGSGNDRLYGRGGNDTLVGGKQNDTIYGEAGDDNLSGNDGNDYLDGGAGADTLFGGAGSDSFGDSADGSTDLIDGGEDDDTLLGHDADDVVALLESVN